MLMLDSIHQMSNSQITNSHKYWMITMIRITILSATLSVLLTSFQSWKQPQEFCWILVEIHLSTAYQSQPWDTSRSQPCYCYWWIIPSQHRHEVWLIPRELRVLTNGSCWPWFSIQAPAASRRNVLQPIWFPNIRSTQTLHLDRGQQQSTCWRIHGL